MSKSIIIIPLILSLFASIQASGPRFTQVNSSPNFLGYPLLGTDGVNYLTWDSPNPEEEWHDVYSYDIATASHKIQIAPGSVCPNGTVFFSSPSGNIFCNTTKGSSVILNQVNIETGSLINSFTIPISAGFNYEILNTNYIVFMNDAQTEVAVFNMETSTLGCIPPKLPKNLELVGVFPNDETYTVANLENNNNIEFYTYNCQTKKSSQWTTTSGNYEPIYMNFYSLNSSSVSVAVMQNAYDIQSETIEIVVLGSNSIQSSLSFPGGLDYDFGLGSWAFNDTHFTVLYGNNEEISNFGLFYVNSKMQVVQAEEKTFEFAVHSFRQTFIPTQLQFTDYYNFTALLLDLTNLHVLSIFNVLDENWLDFNNGSTLVVLYNGYWINDTNNGYSFIPMDFITMPYSDFTNFDKIWELLPADCSNNEETCQIVEFDASNSKVSYIPVTPCPFCPNSFLEFNLEDVQVSNGEYNLTAWTWTTNSENISLWILQNNQEYYNRIINKYQFPPMISFSNYEELSVTLLILGEQVFCLDTFYMIPGNGFTRFLMPNASTGYLSLFLWKLSNTKFYFAMNPFDIAAASVFDLNTNTLVWSQNLDPYGGKFGLLLPIGFSETTYPYLQACLYQSSETICMTNYEGATYCYSKFMSGYGPYILNNEEFYLNGELNIGYNLIFNVTSFEEPDKEEKKHDILKELAYFLNK